MGLSITEQSILRAYNKGWKDCSNNKPRYDKYLSFLLQRAYNIGYENYIIGDEVTSVDAWSDEQIIKYVQNP